MGVRPRWDPSADAYYAALTSSDPGSALNVFGNGEGQGTMIDGFLTTTQGPIVGESETNQYNLTLRGSLFDMWGGRASYTVGTEYRENIVYKERDFTSSSSGRLFHNKEDTGSKIGVDKPSREISAYYAEVALPLVGPENARPGVHSLILSLQARRDQNESTASAYIGTRGAYLSFEFLDPLPVPYWHPEDGWLIYEQAQWVFHYEDVVHDFNYTTTKQNRISPSIGLRYPAHRGIHSPGPVVACLPPSGVERPVCNLHRSAAGLVLFAGYAVPYELSERRRPLPPQRPDRIRASLWGCRTTGVQHGPQKRVFRHDLRGLRLVPAGDSRPALDR